MDKRKEIIKKIWDAYKAQGGVDSPRARNLKALMTDVLIPIDTSGSVSERAIAERVMRKFEKHLDRDSGFMEETEDFCMERCFVAKFEYAYDNARGNLHEKIVTEYVTTNTIAEGITEVSTIIRKAYPNVNMLFINYKEGT